MIVDCCVSKHQERQQGVFGLFALDSLHQLSNNWLTIGRFIREGVKGGQSVDCAAADQFTCDYQETLTIDFE